MFGSFSPFYIEIAYSNFTFCGAWTEIVKNLGKQAHPQRYYFEMTNNLEWTLTIVLSVIDG